MIFQASDKWPYHISSGGLVYKQDDEEIKVVLLKHSSNDRFAWHLPKGTVKDDETLQTAALREVAEETGFICKIVAYLGSAHWILPAEVEGYEIDKTAHYFLMEFEKESGEGMDGEYDELLWCNLDEADKKLKGSYKSEEQILARARTWLSRNAG